MSKIFCGSSPDPTGAPIKAHPLRLHIYFLHRDTPLFQADCHPTLGPVSQARGATRYKVWWDFWRSLYCKYSLPSACVSEKFCKSVKIWCSAIKNGSLLFSSTLYMRGPSVDKKAVLSQRWPRNAPYTWVPWNFWDSLTTPMAIIPNIFHGLLFRSTLWMFLQNLKSVAVSVLEIIRGTPKKLGSPWIRPRSIFSKIFNGLLFRIAPVYVPAKFEVRSFTCSWDKRGS